MEVAKRAKEEIPFIKAYAAVKFSGEVIDSFSEEEIPLSELLKDISEIVSKYLHTYKTLGEYSVGIPKEISHHQDPDVAGSIPKWLEVNYSALTDGASEGVW